MSFSRLEISSAASETERSLTISETEGIGFLIMDLSAESAGRGLEADSSNVKRSLGVQLKARQRSSMFLMEMDLNFELTRVAALDLEKPFL